MSVRDYPLSVSAERAKALSCFSLSRVWRALGLVAAAALCSPLWAQVIPKVTLSVADTREPSDVAVALQILFLVTILAIAPSILVMLTSFVRIIIAFSFLRRALGTQTMPPDQVMVGMALFLTLFIMMPVFTEINDTAIQPYLAEEIGFRDGLDKAVRPVRNFMLRQVDEKDVALFVRVSRMAPPRNADDLPLEVIVPAFITSELKTAFIIGFVLYVPFLVIDMVIASVLLSMGMMMLPPIMISLPFKIVLFVLIDGWHIVVRELVTSFR
ncbi:MAG: flagellar type III secretion system pore protein FliP [Chitinivibrionales bacterium]|nr:flagellar type III secretion system pore protein FliP [Chitinivibrionales bacterium]MBD3394028.1 flagellar type III secretion system pore protein FliP [Chitinivibrionales bacterium]